MRSYLSALALALAAPLVGSCGLVSPDITNFDLFIMDKQFTSKEVVLKHLLEQASTGAVQLPDFQRGWVWDDEHIQSLLVSIARSFPIGAVMLLETGGETRFEVRAAGPSLVACPTIVPRPPREAPL